MKQILKSLTLSLFISFFSAPMMAMEELNEFPLIQAIIKRDRQKINELIAQGADPNQRDRHDRTPLMYSSGIGDHETTNLLLKSGADINLVDINGWTALMVTAMRNNVEIAELLIEEGANVNAQANAPHNTTALLLALNHHHFEIADLLLACGANTELLSNGLTPLFIAIEQSDSESVSFLLEHGAPLTHCDGETPLTFACSLETEENAEDNVAIIAELLEYKADVNEPNAHGNGPLHVILHRNNPDIMQAITTLLQYEPNVDLPNIAGSTPLMLAIRNPEVLEKLISQTKNINRKNQSGFTALHAACADGQTQAIQLLLSAKADPYAQDDEDGDTPLTIFCNSFYWRRLKNLAAQAGLIERPERKTDVTKEHIDCVNALLNARVQIDACDMQKTTALMRLAGNIPEDVCDAMQEYQQQGPTITREALCQGLNLTPLAKLLIDRGANRELRDKKGQTALDFAKREQNSGMIELLDSHRPWGAADLKLKAAKALMEKCASLDATKASVLINEVPEDIRVEVEMLASQVPLPMQVVKD